MHEEDRKLTDDGTEDMTVSSTPEATLTPNWKGGDAYESDVKADPEDHAVLEDSPEDPDPDSRSDQQLDGNDDPLALSREISRLRAELEARDDLIHRFADDYREFGVLYPGVGLEALPESVWQDAKRGIPLAAAYALYRHKEGLREAAASASNRQNICRSPGGVEPTPNDYYSPDEVRAMSQSQVRKHYRHIMKSMESWH